MFGVMRLYLALAVAAYHVLGVPFIGQYAVFAFFVLSGFLMTTIMHDSYGYTLAGRQRFVVNRFLRLYPSYWIAAVVAILVVLYCGEAYVRQYKDVLYLPRSASSILSNLTMVYPNVFPTRIEPRLSPPTWAITIELFFYALICLGISKSRIATTAWLAVSVIYVIVTVVLNTLPGYRYSSIFAGSLPFSMGACLYFFKKDIADVLNAHRAFSIRNLALAHIATYALIVVGYKYTRSDFIQESGLYITTALTALMVVKLYYVKAPGPWVKWDKLMGDYSYPVYLLHWQLSALASFLLKSGAAHARTHATIALFPLTMAMVFAVATAIIFGVDPMVERLRRVVRRPAAARGAVNAMSAAS